MDLSINREHGRMPSQVSSEFLINKEQGDWAEKTLLDAINKNSTKYLAVKYGRSDNLIAGDEKFSEFYEAYQKELDTIGKKPDILIFEKNDLAFLKKSFFELSEQELNSLIPKAKCGIEVRSSSFISGKYEAIMKAKYNSHIRTIYDIKNQILANYKTALFSKDSALLNTIESITEKNIHCISFRTPTWKSSPILAQLADLLKQMKQALNEIQNKRFHLSITPKVEDLKVVYNWVKKYNVPHYYVQVFFDKAYGISFERILKLISNPENEEKSFFIESDVKNQNKTVIKIQTTTEKQILDSVELPKHHSHMKELARGNLLFYVKFDSSKAVINKAAFKELLGIDL